MKVLTLPYIDNASHGYIKISKYDLIGFKIFDKFSSFSYYKPETACDFEKILQQKLINQGRVSFKETLQETKKRGKYNRGRPRKEKNG